MNRFAKRKVEQFKKRGQNTDVIAPSGSVRGVQLVRKPAREDMPMQPLVTPKVPAFLPDGSDGATAQQFIHDRKTAETVGKILDAIHRDNVVDPSDTIVLVVSSSSPIAPPNIRALGSEKSPGFGVINASRREFGERARKTEELGTAGKPLADHMLGLPVCGCRDHIELFVATRDGLAVGCSHCTFGFEHPQQRLRKQN